MGSVRFEFVLDLKTARRPGMSMPTALSSADAGPQSCLMRCDVTTGTSRPFQKRPFKVSLGGRSGHAGTSLIRGIWSERRTCRWTGNDPDAWLRFPLKPRCPGSLIMAYVRGMPLLPPPLLHLKIVPASARTARLEVQTALEI